MLVLASSTFLSSIPTPPRVLSVRPLPSVEGFAPDPPPPGLAKLTLPLCHTDSFLQQQPCSPAPTKSNKRKLPDEHPPARYGPISFLLFTITLYNRVSCLCSPPALPHPAPSSSTGSGLAPDLPTLLRLPASVRHPPSAHAAGFLLLNLTLHSTQLPAPCVSHCFLLAFSLNHVNSFSMAAVTNYHTLGVLKHRFIP